MTKEHETQNKNTKLSKKPFMEDQQNVPIYIFYFVHLVNFRHTDDSCL